jgi:hypothetical protein
MRDIDTDNKIAACHKQIKHSSGVAQNSNACVSQSSWLSSNVCVSPLASSLESLSLSSFLSSLSSTLASTFASTLGSTLASTLASTSSALSSVFVFLLRLLLSRRRPCVYPWRCHCFDMYFVVALFCCILVDMYFVVAFCCCIFLALDAHMELVKFKFPKQTVTPDRRDITCCAMI